MRKYAPAALILVSVLGLWLGADLTEKHFLLTHAASEDFDSICDVNATFNCSKVNSSKYSAVPLGDGRAELPIAVPAMGFFAMTGVLALFALFGDEGRRRKTMTVIGGFSALGVAFGLYLVVIQAFVLKAWCLFCLGVDASTAAVLVLAVIAHGGGRAGFIADLKKPDSGVVAMAVVLLLAIGGGAYGSYNGKVREAGGLEKRTLADASSSGASSAADPHAGHKHGPGEDHAHGGHGHSHDTEKPKTLDEMSPEEREEALAETRRSIKEFLEAQRQQPVKDLEINPYDGSKGNAESKVVLVEFADFECPHCQQMAFVLQDIAQRYYDHVHFVFKHYPLGQACNEQLSRDVHPDACLAAVATQCARRQGEFWAFHDRTFDNQGSLGRRKLLKISDTVGLDRGRFEECLQRDDVWDEVRSTVAQGRSVGISGTPSFFLNGRELASVHPVAIEAALRSELLAAGTSITDLPPDPDGLFGL